MASSANIQMKTASDNYEEKEEEHFSNAMQLVTACAVPMVLLTAFQLGVFEIIENSGPISAAQIAAQLDLTNPDAAVMLDRMLRLLASHSVVTCSTVEAAVSVYGMTPTGKYFVGNQELGGASLGPLLALNQDKVSNDSWYALKDAVVEGGVPFNKIHGTSLFEYAGKDPKFNDIFNQAMLESSAIITNKILHTYKGFHNLKTLVDVGGNLGITISKITTKYPTIKGINFDQPHVVQHAQSYSGVQHIGGDMFESVPGGDAILLKAILHNWDDDHCLKLLRNCYNSIPDNGKVIVIDAVFLVNPDTSSSVKSSCQMDAVMLTQIQGGKDRQEQEYLALAIAAGFKGIKKICFVCDVWIMEFYK